MPHALRLAVSVAAIAATALLFASCAASPDAGDGRGAQAAGAAPAGEDALAVGAVDPEFRRGGTVTNDPFAPLDLPAPSDKRLGSGAPGPDYWQQRVDYDIDATLLPSDDPERDGTLGRLEASVRVTYQNNSPHELEFLWLQLEQNLFRTDSLGTLSRSPGSVMKPLTSAFEGGYDIPAIVAGGRTLEFSVHDTLARVELPRPIGAGERFEFELRFAFDVPPHLRRMGAERVEQGTIFEFAQWFPHVCNYDDVNGWNALPYLGSGEFYTNFGRYTVDLTVPREYVVTATGTLTNASEVLTSEQRSRLARSLSANDPVSIIAPGEVGTPGVRPAGPAQTTWRFEADDVRTFAWAASDAFIWDAIGASVTGDDGRERTVLAQSLYPREARGWSPAHKSGGSTRMVKHSIEFYSDWLYPYPYPHMTNVNGPEGGMEYPMIMFCGDRDDDDGPFGVTDHEVGHTWFPMIVNSDERRHMWQDEGLNSFIGIYSGAEWRGTDPDVRRHLEQVLSVANAVHPQPIVRNPDQHWPRWVGRLNYRKVALALYLLREEVLGAERFDRAFRAYIDRWAFKHPQPGDFFRTIEDAAGADLSWFWRGWFLEPAVLDQGVVGAIDAGNGRVAVDLVSLGTQVMPVELDVEYTDGSRETRRLPVQIWHTSDKWRAAWDAGGRTVASVVVDPRRVFPDIDRANNAWPSARSGDGRGGDEADLGPDVPGAQVTPRRGVLGY
ncbi:MAG: M1 family metallopeptidase [Planctomycetota bacterium]